MNARQKKLGAFKDDLIALYHKHGVSIGHEDHHGAFIIRNLRESDIRWIKNATNEATEPLTNYRAVNRAERFATRTETPTITSLDFGVCGYCNGPLNDQYSCRNQCARNGRD